MEEWKVPGSKLGKQARLPQIAGVFRKRHRKLLSGVYARGSKISHTGTPNIYNNNNNNGRNGSFLYVAGYLVEERRRWPEITASPRGQCSK